MQKIAAILLITSLFFIEVLGYSQQPSLSVQSFEYIWEKATEALPSSDNSRIIIASDDSVKRGIENAFATALKQRWNIEMTGASLSVKPLGMFSYSPKFKTRLKEKQAGTWYLFLQIFDKREITYVSADNPGRLVSTLELKCRLIDGANDSVILDRMFTTELYEQPSPPDQVILTKLPGYPAGFVQAFDSIAKWVFQPEDPGQKILRIKPACVFTGLALPATPVAELDFNSNSNVIHHLSQPSFLFKTPGPGYKRVDTKHNRGGNTLSGAVSLFTGANINKVRVFEYSADFPFEESDSVYHCIINYAERESAERKREKTRNSDGSKSYSLESGEYQLTDRGTDSSFLNAITLAGDTLATFRISYIPVAGESNNYNQYWDGSDSATITSLPKKWNNQPEGYGISITGQTGTNAFSMKTVREMNAKGFYIDGQLAMIMYGKILPAKAVLFQMLSARQLKMFAILASLPYPYFNYSAY